MMYHAIAAIMDLLTAHCMLLASNFGVSYCFVVHQWVFQMPSLIRHTIVSVFVTLVDFLLTSCFRQLLLSCHAKQFGLLGQLCIYSMPHHCLHFRSSQIDRQSTLLPTLTPPCQPTLPSTAAQWLVILPSSPFQPGIPSRPAQPSSSHLSPACKPTPSAINQQLNTDHQLPYQHHHQLRQPAVTPGLLLMAHFGNVLLNLAHHLRRSRYCLLHRNIPSGGHPFGL